MHAIYWTVQISLIILAIETGVQLAVNINRIGDGNNGYTNDTDDYSWPLNPSQWYINTLLQITFQNMFFAIFMIGMLKVCAKLSNPLDLHDLGFPEDAYGMWLS